VATLAGSETVELTWSPSAEPDLAGYRIYRGPEGGAPVRVAEIPAGQTTWTDARPGRGGLHLYTVTAYDRVGNESLPSKPAEGHLQ
jgi:fibronectin type 3 domain-containing protein